MSCPRPFLAVAFFALALLMGLPAPSRTDSLAGAEKEVADAITRLRGVSIAGLDQAGLQALGTRLDAAVGVLLDLGEEQPDEALANLAQVDPNAYPDGMFEVAATLAGRRPVGLGALAIPRDHATAEGGATLLHDAGAAQAASGPQPLLNRALSAGADPARRRTSTSFSRLSGLPPLLRAGACASCRRPQAFRLQRGPRARRARLPPRVRAQA